MTPDLRAIMCGATARVQRKTPRRFASMTVSNCSSDITETCPSFTFTSMPSRRMPALLTRTSICPKASITFVVAAVTSAASATETRVKVAAEAPAAFSSATIAGSSPLRSHTATLQPSAAKARAVPFPMPLAPPVTITTLFLSPVSIMGGSF